MPFLNSKQNTGVSKKFVNFAMVLANHVFLSQWYGTVAPHHRKSNGPSQTKSETLNSPFKLSTIKAKVRSAYIT